MLLTIGFKNPATGEIRRVKCGWSWTIFFFCWVFGLPLFLRGLIGWGGVFLLLILAHGGIHAHGAYIYHPGAHGLRLISIVLWIWISANGNKLTAKRYLRRGWVFENPLGEFTQMARRQWGIG
jgi:hypothetical protein